MKRVTRLKSHLISREDESDSLNVPARNHTSSSSSQEIVPQWQQAGNKVTDEWINGKDELSLLSPLAQDVLTQEQMKQYETQGFLVVKSLLTAAEIQEILDHFQGICNGDVYSGDMTVMRDIILAREKKGINGEKEVTKIQDWQEDEILFKYCKNEKIVNYVRAFIGDSIRSIHTMLINKPPDLGEGTSEHPMHQDLLYFPLRPASKIVAAWTALEKITPENGCLTVIPGSHLDGLMTHSIQSQNVGYQGVKNMQEKAKEKIYLTMDPGDTVFFHPCLIHGSGINSSSGFRKAISCHYASGKETVFTTIPTHNFGLLDEFFALTEKRMGSDFKLSQDEKLALYHMAWRSKSRQVLGESNYSWNEDE